MWHIVIGHFSCIRTRAIVSALPFLCTNKVCSVDLHSIPDLLITRYMNINECMKRNECHRDGYPYLHPSVNDNREEADREYVEELEKLKQPHDEGGKGSVHFHPSYPGDCLWECRPVILNPWYQWVVLKCWNRSDSGVWLFWLGSINWKCLLVIHILFWQSACTSCDRISTQIRIKLGF